MSNQIKRGSVAGVALLASALALTAPAAAGHESAAKPTKIFAKERGGGGGFAFKPSEASVRSGGKIALRNRTPGEPHSFSLVKRSDVPTTRDEERKCFKGNNICRRLFEAHQGGEKILVDRHREGFDRPVDSILWDDSLTIDVSADRGKRLNFLCAIHPDMHGVLDVR